MLVFPTSSLRNSLFLLPTYECATHTTTCPFFILFISLYFVYVFVRVSLSLCTLITGPDSAVPSTLRYIVFVISVCRCRYVYIVFLLFLSPPSFFPHFTFSLEFNYVAYLTGCHVVCPNFVFSQFQFIYIYNDNLLLINLSIRR